MLQHPGDPILAVLDGLHVKHRVHAFADRLFVEAGDVFTVTCHQQLDQRFDHGQIALVLGQVKRVPACRLACLNGVVLSPQCPNVNFCTTVLVKKYGGELFGLGTGRKTLGFCVLLQHVQDKAQCHGFTHAGGAQHQQVCQCFLVEIVREKINVMRVQVIRLFARGLEDGNRLSPGGFIAFTGVEIVERGQLREIGTADRRKARTQVVDTRELCTERRCQRFLGKRHNQANVGKTGG
ncbi:relaxase [Pseudomonas syringae pv. broussonetiae]|uniref:Uncharacterized protein n=1 Tax=Pseudomonas savastanoi TaxID=29438 RepID=A0A3M5BUV9_PSESS|nr:relaxase [Pseudomonas syringae pv. broussonetiae]RMS29114.1 hypothetical protein ALP70_200165 [Pseudomonas savastanoi]RMT17577.1 hypothetical protein ALP51_200070 [Pseudomonas savastanoi]